jgi:hypothetical protein
MESKIKAIYYVAPRISDDLSSQNSTEKYKNLPDERKVECKPIISIVSHGQKHQRANITIIVKMRCCCAERDCGALTITLLLYATLCVSARD